MKYWPNIFACGSQLWVYNLHPNPVKSTSHITSGTSTQKIRRYCLVGLVKNWSKNLIRLCISYMVRYIIWGTLVKKSTHFSQNRPSAAIFSFIYWKSLLWDRNFWIMPIWPWSYWPRAEIFATFIGPYIRMFSYVIKFFVSLWVEKIWRPEVTL